MKKEFLGNAITFTAVLVAGLFILLYGYMGMRWGQTYTNISLKLPHTSQLSPGSPLLLRGVKIGDVTDVRPSTEGVEVDVRYPSDYRIPVDSEISIDQLSALSEPYISISPRTSGGAVLASGTVLTASAVNQSRSIADIFTSFAALNRTADSSALASLINTLWKATSGRDDDLTALSKGGQLLSATILSRMPAIRQMFTDTQVYSADMQWLPGSLQAVGPAFAKTSDAVRAAVEEVAKMVMTLQAPDPFTNTINPFLARLKPYLDELLPALATTGGPFISIFSALNRTLPQIDLSAFLSTALQVAGTDGAAHLTLTLPRP